MGPCQQVNALVVAAEQVGDHRQPLEVLHLQRCEVVGLHPRVVGLLPGLLCVSLPAACQTPCPFRHRLQSLIGTWHGSR
jgi:hypothetical protein